MKTRNVVVTGRALVAFAIGSIMILMGAGAGLVSFTTVTTASAATAKATTPIPVVEQNLDSAGRIRVALPTNANGQIQTSQGDAGATILTNNCWLCWAQVGRGQTATIINFQGQGVFQGIQFDTCLCWGGNNNPDGVITIYIDGQVVLNGWMSWYGANWMQQGDVLGGEFCTFWNCAGATMHWWPPGGISFNQSIVVTWYSWACCTGAPTGAAAAIFYNSITPVTSSPN